jgi:hypothetical protein
MVARNYGITEAYDKRETKDILRDKAKVEQCRIKGCHFGNAYPVYGIRLAVVPDSGHLCVIKLVLSV